jgi:hypothetical protein
MNGQRLSHTIARHVDASPAHAEMTAADAIRVRQHRIARQLIRIGIGRDMTAAAEYRHQRAVAAPVEAGDAAAQRRRHVEPQMGVGERHARHVAATRLTHRHRRCARPRQHRMGGGRQPGAARLCSLGIL